MKKKTISEYPHMMAQWHPTKNPQFDVHTTAAGTREQAWWLCRKCGYEWQALISTRKESKGYCPRCDKDKQGPKTKTTIAMVPHLIDFWDFEANPDIDPYTLTATKNRDANWKCPDCGYKWIANIHGRYYDKTGCPACAGAVATEKNNALVRYPDLEYYYDYDYPDNPPLESLLPTSSTDVHWRCPDCGHKWKQPVSQRIKKGEVAGCSICTGARIKGTYADEYPEAAEMYSPKNTILFRDLHAKDRTTTFLWDCPNCGYEFESTLGSMLKLSKRPHKGCPVCLGKVVAPPGESVADLYPELLDELDDDIDLHKILPNSRREVNWKCKKCGYKWTATIALRSMGYGKCAVCNNTRPIKGYNTVADLFYDIAKQWAPSNKIKADEILPLSHEWVMLVCPDCGIEHSVQVCQATVGNIQCPYCSGIKAIPGVNSLKAVHEDWLKYWDYEKNTIDPDHTRADSTGDCFWFCDKGHRYSMKVSVRASFIEEGRELCPYCDQRLPIPGINSLKVLHPEWMDEFDQENTVDPDTIFETYTFPILWICKQGHHYWRSPSLRLQDVAEGRISCPICDDRQVQPGINSFAAKHKDLLEEWDYVNNYVIADPDYISDRSNIRVWFRCLKDPKHGNYDMQVSRRVLFKERGHNPCPICKGRRRKKKHFV